ncbi:LON peptidase N-terminal domain and RING finger protein 3 [Chironomus tepperi]|uniref:LON peptidase N-terminal domain and RING finger protein 3 n=1 Tax=Chironomus tepperi TaxID=113505 RepID=UPI00391F4F1F
MATLLELAKDAFKNHNYILSCEIYERLLREKGRKSTELYFGYGDSLAKCARIKEALDIYAHICYQLCEIIPVEKLKCLASSIIEFIVNKRTNATNNNNNNNSLSSCDIVDPLCCPVCEDVLKYPVTSLCGHTYCRECCFGRTKCIVCEQKFPIINTAILHNNKHHESNNHQQQQPLPSSSTTTITTNNINMPSTTIIKNSTITSENENENDNSVDMSNNSDVDMYQWNDDSDNIGIGFEQDILIRRFVEKWWSPHLKASELNDEAERYLQQNLLDEALKCCNQSLDHAPNNFKGLLLRSHVLYRLKHYQSSLADVENALKSRPTSYKSHYRRALALSGLGRIEESFVAYCVSICLDKRSENLTNSLRYDLSRLLQRIFMSNRSINSHLLSTSAPYILTTRSRRRQRYFSEQHEQHDYHQFISNNEYDYEDDNSSCGEGEDYNPFLDRIRNRHNRRLFRRLNNINHNHLDSQQIIPRQNARLRSLFDRVNQEIEKYRRMEPKSSSLLDVDPSKIEPSDFDCVLCCRTLYRPVVTPCGHTYCWVCLDRCMDYSTYCPLCMAPLIEQYRNHLNFNHIQNPTLLSLSRRNTTRFIETAMKRYIPKIYAKRQQQELEKEPAIPIFICTTAFPSVPCPLFIYEPRYRLMVRRAIESGTRQFGIVLAQSTRQRYVDYGTMLEIRDCVQLADGCSILSTVGTKRFRVIRRSEKDGYETANIEYIKDEAVCDENYDSIMDLHYRVMEKAKQWCESLPENIKNEILKSFGQMPELEMDWEISCDGPSWTWWIIAILPLSPLLKVNILATTSLEKRLRAIDKTLIEYMAAQQKRSLCLLSGCEGLPTCQAIECCQRATSTQQLDDRHHSNTNQSTEYLL